MLSGVGLACSLLILAPICRGNRPAPFLPSAFTLSNSWHYFQASANGALCNSMKIATFNVNGIRSRLSNLVEWLQRESPDVVCLQELKATDDAFPVLALRAAGYESVWNGQKSWNGVAILARGAVPVET